MFVTPTYVGFTHRVVAMLVACAVVLGSIGIYNTAQAANLTLISDTLTDSGPNALSGHSIQFTIPANGSPLSSDGYSIVFPGSFNFGSLATGDVSTTHGTVSSVAANTITVTGATAATGTTITVTVAEGEIANPGVVDSYELQLSTTEGDSGRTRVAIVDYVEVTAIVETSFDFVVSGLATSTSVNGTTTTGASTATAIPFGILAADTVYTIGQQLSVETNAANGFVVTVQQDGNLQSSTGADIDGFSNGTYVNTPVAWTAPSDSLLNENTWGHWGLTSNDSDLNGSEFTTGGGDRWVAASTTPRIVFSHNDPADGTTQDYGQAEVAYRVQITPLQEAGDDYNTTLMYIATPTF